MRKVVLAAVLVGLMGCQSNEDATYPVEGRVEHPGVAALAGSHVEAVLVGNEAERASGEIQPDGRFTL